MMTQPNQFLALKALLWANWCAFGNVLLLMGGDDSVDIRLHFSEGTQSHQKISLPSGDYPRG